MQIITDRGCDISPEQLEKIKIHFAPMKLTLDDKTYSSGIDLSAEEFYNLMENTESMPVTSQAAVGDFVELYKKVADEDPEILSIHISSGLSGTLNSATTAAAMVPNAKITHWDTLTLSAPQAWQVEAAALAVKAGWSMQQILDMLTKIRQATEGIFTVETLKYLIHGGRISHLQGMIASLLQIRPVMAVEKEIGKYYTLGKERTTPKALAKLAQSITRFVPEGSEIRAQLLHGNNPSAVAKLKEEVEKLFTCTWLPTVHVGPILGAHTGGSLVGICITPMKLWRELVP
jgi:DegV family protein with EDD domain